jgi:hypothetical protein
MGLPKRDLLLFSHGSAGTHGARRRRSWATARSSRRFCTARCSPDLARPGNDLQPCCQAAACAACSCSAPQCTQALTYLIVVLHPHAGRGALEALHPDTARLRQAYMGGALQGIIVTAAGGVTVWQTFSLGGMLRSVRAHVVAAGVRYSTPWCARAHAVISALGRRRRRRAGLCITRVRPVGGHRRGSRDGLLARGARALLAAALGDRRPAAAREAVFAARRRDGVRRGTRQRAAAQQRRCRAEGQLAAGCAQGRFLLVGRA